MSDEHTSGWGDSDPHDHTADALRYSAMAHPGQSKKESLLEANVNTWLGLAGSWLITWSTMLYLDTLGLFWATNITVAGCTVWSLARGYFVRRYFENRRFKLDAGPTRW